MSAPRRRHPPGDDGSIGGRPWHGSPRRRARESPRRAPPPRSARASTTGRAGRRGTVAAAQWRPRRPRCARGARSPRRARGPPPRARDLARLPLELGGRVAHDLLELGHVQRRDCSRGPTPAAGGAPPSAGAAAASAARAGTPRTRPRSRAEVPHGHREPFEVGAVRAQALHCTPAAPPATSREMSAEDGHQRPAPARTRTAVRGPRRRVRRARGGRARRATNHRPAGQRAVAQLSEDRRAEAAVRAVAVSRSPQT